MRRPSWKFDLAAVDHPSAVLESRTANVVGAVTDQDAALFELLELRRLCHLREKAGRRRKFDRSMSVLVPGLRDDALGIGIVGL